MQLQQLNPLGQQPPIACFHLVHEELQGNQMKELKQLGLLDRQDEEEQQQQLQQKTPHQATHEWQQQLLNSFMSMDYNSKHHQSDHTQVMQKQPDVFQAVRQERQCNTSSWLTHMVQQKYMEFQQGAKMPQLSQQRGPNPLHLEQQRDFAGALPRQLFADPTATLIHRLAKVQPQVRVFPVLCCLYVGDMQPGSESLADTTTTQGTN